jgi:Primosomal protein N'' (replication factor Y) - superfamily II helicase
VDEKPELVEVALPLPLFQTFTYAVPAALRERVRTGARVVVPFRNRRQIGICIGPGADKKLKRAPKQILDAPDAEPAVGEKLLELCRWIGEYYVVPLGVVLRTALPILLTGAENPRPARKTQRVVKLRALVGGSNAAGARPIVLSLEETARRLRDARNPSAVRARSSISRRSSSFPRRCSRDSRSAV